MKYNLQFLSLSIQEFTILKEGMLFCYLNDLLEILCINEFNKRNGLQILNLLLS